MKPFSDYLGHCQRLTAEEFQARFPWAFFVHSSVTGRPLKPPRAQRMATIDRLVIEEALRQITPESRERPVVYGVYEARPRDGAPAQRLTVGCDEGCDIVIDDASVSRVHAHLSKTGNRYAILDNDSTAGTQINEQPVAGGHAGALGAGDRVTFGNVTLEFFEAAGFFAFVRKWLGK
jgi:hypothetical protein